MSGNDRDEFLSDQSDDGEASQSAPIPNAQARGPKTKSANQTKNKKRLVKHIPVPKSNIARMLITLVNNEMRDSLEWLKESLGDAGEDYEVGNNEGIPLVPVMDYAETAMENVEFQQLLKALGVCSPFDEQEVYWRIPGHLTPQLLQSYEHMIQQALDNTLVVEPEEPTVETSRIEKDESSDDEYLFDRIKTVPVVPRDTTGNEQGSIPSNITTVATKSANETQDTSGLAELTEENAEVLEQPSEVEFHIQEFNLDDNETGTIYGGENKVFDENGKVSENDDFLNAVEPAKGESSRKKTRHVFESDSDDETEKRQRSVSSSDSDAPITKRARIIDSDDE
ncbi:hypothetical protein HUJ05_001932 [Dendroctonus ponderosae]|nr:hypothetical protein HUJ05_001932 [Dendroctonus ponderosae]